MPIKKVAVSYQGLGIKVRADRVFSLQPKPTFFSHKTSGLPFSIRLAPSPDGNTSIAIETPPDNLEVREPIRMEDISSEADLLEHLKNGGKVIVYRGINGGDSSRPASPVPPTGEILTPSFVTADRANLLERTIEYVRNKQFPECPSRFECIFAASSPKQARRWGQVVIRIELSLNQPDQPNNPPQPIRWLDLKYYEEATNEYVSFRINRTRDPFASRSLPPVTSDYIETYLGSSGTHGNKDSEILIDPRQVTCKVLGPLSPEEHRQYIFDLPQLPTKHPFWIYYGGYKVTPKEMREKWFRKELWFTIRLSCRQDLARLTLTDLEDKLRHIRPESDHAYWADCGGYLAVRNEALRQLIKAKLDGIQDIYEKTEPELVHALNLVFKEGPSGIRLTLKEAKEIEEALDTANPYDNASGQEYQEVISALKTAEEIARKHGYKIFLKKLENCVYITNFENIEKEYRTACSIVNASPDEAAIQEARNKMAADARDEFFSLLSKKEWKIILSDWDFYVDELPIADLIATMKATGTWDNKAKMALSGILPTIPKRSNGLRIQLESLL